MGFFDYSLTTRVVFILSLPFLLYLFLPQSIAERLLTVFKTWTVVNLVLLGAYEAFYPPTWLYTTPRT